jgi:hypothetical protein
MSRIAGRRGRIYMGIASDTASAEPLPFFASWSMSFATNKIDVTAMGDSNMVYVSGLPDASGEFSGFYDDATGQTYAAAIDGLARKFYLYPNTSTATQYFFGTILPDFTVNAQVDGAVEVSASWNAATTIAKVG